MTQVNTATRRRLLLAAALALAQTGPIMSTAHSKALPLPPQNDPLLWFKMKAGIVDIVNPPAPGPELVLAQWPPAAAMLGVDAQWTIDKDFFFIPNAKGASHQYGAQKGGQQRKIEIFLSANGFPGAVDRMVELATTTMMAEPPYDKAPAAMKMGELTLVSNDPEHQTLIFTFHNLCVRVDTIAGGLETLQLAKRIHEGLQRRLVNPTVFEMGRPRLALPTSPVNLQQGQSTTIVPAAPGTAATGLELLAMPDSAAVGVLAQSPSRIVLKGVVPGTTRLGVVIAETTSLRCDAGVLTCVVS